MLISSTLLLLIGTAHLCSGSITVDVDRVYRKDAKSPYQRFRLNKTTTSLELPEKLKFNGTLPIPIDLNSRNGLAYAGPVYLGET